MGGPCFLASTSRSTNEYLGAWLQSASMTCTDRRTISLADGCEGAADRHQAEIAASRKTGLDTALHPASVGANRIPSSEGLDSWTYAHTLKLQSVNFAKPLPHLRLFL